MSEHLIIGTGVFGKFEPENFQSHISPFLNAAREFGPVVVVSQDAYPYSHELGQFVVNSVRKADDFEVIRSQTVGAKSPADMCNQIIRACARRGFEYFAVVSSDLAPYIPTTFPIMLNQLQHNPELTSVGIAIQGVHNLALLEEIREHGSDRITPDNYATIFHNNAFSIHRLHPQVGETTISISSRLFPRVTDQETLGTIDIDGQKVPIGGNEEIALVLQLLKQEKNINTLLMAGNFTIIRDPNQEISSIDTKILRRPAVARRYQQHYDVSDQKLNDYLQDHYQITFS